MLTVPKPFLEYEKATDGKAFLEKPLKLKVAPIKENSTVLGPDKLTVFGYFAYRRLAPGSSPEIWDDKAKQWKPDPGPNVTGLSPVQLAYKEGEAAPWEGLLVAGGAKDGSGQPQYAKEATGYPLYSFRGWFSSKVSNEAILGEPSDNVAFVSAADRNLLVIGADEGEMPDSATLGRFELKNSAQQVIGRLLIERGNPGAKITIANGAGASVVMHQDGRIEIVPAAGQGLLIAGDLDAERITYRPAGGGAKQVLI